MRTVHLPKDLTSYRKFFVCSSAGKDSAGMSSVVAAAAREAGVLDRVTMIHNDLGKTDAGTSIEWEGVEELAREHAEQLGIPRFEVLSRELGGFWDELFQHGKWPTPKGPWCTADQKTAQGMKAVTAHVALLEQENGGPLGSPPRILYCLGLRAQESTRRAKTQPLKVDRKHSSGKRVVERCHPIVSWSLKDVWDEIRESGLRVHPAYTEIGMTRLSCKLCFRASKDDLIRSIRKDPAHAARYLWAEKQLGHQFKIEISMRELIIQAGLDPDDLP